MCVCVRVCVCVRACACVRARVCTRVCTRVHVLGNKLMKTRLINLPSIHLHYIVSSMFCNDMCQRCLSQAWGSTEQSNLRRRKERKGERKGKGGSEVGREGVR